MPLICGDVSVSAPPNATDAWNAGTAPPDAVTWMVPLGGMNGAPVEEEVYGS